MADCVWRGEVQPQGKRTAGNGWSVYAGVFDGNDGLFEGLHPEADRGR